MLEDSWKVHATVGVLLLPDVGVRHSGEAFMELKTDLWRTSAANSRSKLAMVPPKLENLTNFRMMLSGQFTHHTMLVPYSFGSI